MSKQNRQRKARLLVTSLFLIVGSYLIGWYALVSVLISDDAAPPISTPGTPGHPKDTIEHLESPSRENRRISEENHLNESNSIDFSADKRVQTREKGGGLKCNIVEQVPAAPIPPGVYLQNKTEILKCWDSAGLQHSRAACGHTDRLNSSLSERLYIVDRCRREVSGDAARGLLNIGMEVDCASGRISFWNLPKTDIQGANGISLCLTKELIGFPLGELEGRFSRYWVDFTVSFGIEKRHEAEANDTKPVEALSRSQELDFAAARRVNVARDRVRVRKKPVDGEILGFIGSGKSVLLLGNNGEWCHVKTTRGNVGWMVCWGLDIPGESTGLSNQ